MTHSHSQRQPLGLLTACLFMVSFSVMGMEIALARLLAVLLSYHYVFLVLALALLGIGLGGVIGWRLHRRPETLRPLALGRQALVFAVSIPAAVFLTIQTGRLTAEAWAIVLISPIVCVPFAAAGVFMSGLYRSDPQGSHRLYALDLLGAAAGAWAAVLLLDALGGVRAAMLAGAGGALSAFLLSLRPQLSKIQAAASLAALLLSLGLGLSGWRTGWLDVPLGRNPDKEIYEALYAFQGEIAATRWTAFGRTDLVRYPGRPEGMDLYLDGTAGSPLHRFSGRTEDLARIVETEMADFPGTFPFRIIAPEARGSALVIGPGGGRDVLLALWGGFERVTAVEVNPDVVDLVRLNSAYSGGIYDGHPRVEMVIGEGRRFIRTSARSFDLIFLSLPVVNTTRSLEGYALTENFLFTVESMGEYWARLTAGGSLAVVAHNDAEALRLFVLALTMLEREGLRAAEATHHLYLVASEDYQCFVLRKTAFTAAEARETARAARGYGFLPQSSFFPFVPATNPRLADLSLGRIDSGDLVQTVLDLGWDIRPVTDNRPFFYKLETALPAPIVYAFGATACLLALVAGGVAFARPEPARPCWVGHLPADAAIFSALGIGFMLVETALLSRFYLVFESPAVAMSVFLSALLGWAALGSWAGGRRHPMQPAQRLRGACLALVPVLLAYAVALPWCMDKLMGLGDGWRPAAAVLLLMPVGTCAGIPFPAGVAWLKAAGLESRIPWMYALNGVASVVGSTLSLLVAIGFGYREVLAAGAAWYLCAYLAARSACEPGRDGIRVSNRTACMSPHEHLTPRCGATCVNPPTHIREGGAHERV